jgi:hypothetical protein
MGYVGIVTALAIRVLAAFALVAVTAGAAPAQPTGEALPGLEAYDQLMTAVLRKWRVPGGALAVARDGRILLARGYGLADRASGAPVEPTSLFRLASLSKTVTAWPCSARQEDARSIPRCRPRRAGRRQFTTRACATSRAPPVGALAGFDHVG